MRRIASTGLAPADSRRSTQSLISALLETCEVGPERPASIGVARRGSIRTRTYRAIP